jgi:signal transduction histidine kinase
VDVEVSSPGDLDLPADVKVALYRVTQEAFSNVAKHARATAVTARVTVDEDGAVTLTVHDDGRGFDPAAVPGGMGLHIMGERLERVGADLAVRSGAGEGTTITAFWRLPASNRQPLEKMEA